MELISSLSYLPQKMVNFQDNQSLFREVVKKIMQATRNLRGILNFV